MYYAEQAVDKYYAGNAASLGIDTSVPHGFRKIYPDVSHCNIIIDNAQGGYVVVLNLHGVKDGEHYSHQERHVTHDNVWILSDLIRELLQKEAPQPRIEPIHGVEVSATADLSTDELFPTTPGKPYIDDEIPF